MHHRLSAISFALGFLAGLACLAALAAATVSGGFSARNRPGRLEAAIAHYALRASVAPSQRNLHNPVASSPESLKEAEDHFADHCATCHGNDGSGHAMLGDGLNPPPPDMRLAATQTKSDGELYSIIKNGVRMTGMPAFGTPGDNDAATWKLVLFIRHLPSLTPDEELQMRKSNPATPSELKERQEEDDFLSGSPEEPARPKGKSK